MTPPELVQEPGAYLVFGASSTRYLHVLALRHRTAEVLYASSAFSYAARSVYHKVQQRLVCPHAADCRLPAQTPPSGVQGIFFALAICRRVREPCASQTIWPAVV